MFGHDTNSQAVPSDNQAGFLADDPVVAPAAPATDPTPSAPAAPEVPAAEAEAPTAPAPAVTVSPDAPAVDDDLLDIKQQALQQLSPLVGHLDQTPEEKFRTTMMMIQASDDQSLIRSAYEAAKAISDEKSRAQALLDVVNEINYFTQQHNS